MSTLRRSTSFRWSNNFAGTYTNRVRSLDPDRLRGPWSVVSNEGVVEVKAPPRMREAVSRRACTRSMKP